MRPVASATRRQRQPAAASRPTAYTHAPGSRSRACGGCVGDRRRQRRAVCCADGARGRRQRAVARGRAAGLARRQLAAHPQPALHARRAAGRAGRGLPGRGVLAGLAQGHRRQDRRGAGQTDGARVGHLPAVDAPPRRAFPAAAVGRAACGAHQRLLHGRRQGAGQCLLPQRRSAGGAGALRHPGRPHRARRRPLRRRACRRRTLCGPGLRAGRRRLRVEPRMAARGLGPERARRMAGRQFPDPRHALQHRGAAQADDRCRGRCHRRRHPGPHGGDRRPRPALRRRHLHPARLGLAGRDGQPRGRTLLRRGRGLLA